MQPVQCFKMSQIVATINRLCNVFIISHSLINTEIQVQYFILISVSLTGVAFNVNVTLHLFINKCIKELIKDLIEQLFKIFKHYTEFSYIVNIVETYNIFDSAYNISLLDISLSLHVREGKQMYNQKLYDMNQK